PEQDFALPERAADQAKLVLFEVAQAAVDQLGRGRRGAAGEVTLLRQDHRKPAAGGVARQAAAIDAAADNRDVVHPLSRAQWISLTPCRVIAGRRLAASAFT